jgi:hypothetical protein
VLGLPGKIEMAVTPVGEGSMTVLGTDDPAHGWSTTKVPVLLALLRAQGGLTQTQQQLATSAITASDNASILDLFADLESVEHGTRGANGYLDALLRRGGDVHTVVATAPPPPGAVTTFGQTEWSPSESARFFASFANDCLVTPEQTAYVLGLMEHIEASERWGLGAPSFGVPVAFKGGWGPEPSGSYLVRQAGIVAPGSPSAVAVAIIARPNGTGETSFSTGTAMVSTTAQWLSRELTLTPRPQEKCPSYP